MTRDDIIRMAREVWGDDSGKPWHESALTHLEAFAKLVAAEEREKWKWEDLHTCHPHCDRPACVAVRRAREDEREACAKVAEAYEPRCDICPSGVAFAIRERGAP